MRNHLIYADTEAKELDRLLDGHKSIIIRSTDTDKAPFNQVSEGDEIYIMNNSFPGEVLAKAVVKNVLFRGDLEPDECTEIINRFLMDLMLTIEQLRECEGQPYLSLIRVEKVERLKPFRVKEELLKDSDDWLVLENIDDIKEENFIM